MPRDDFAAALHELHRVLRPGSLLVAGLWGSMQTRTRVDENGRLFQQHTDDQVRDAVSALGKLVDFETWDWFDDGGHYQWASITTN